MPGTDRESIVNCTICGAPHTIPVYEKEDYYFINQRGPFPLSIRFCSQCRFLFQASAYRDDYDRFIYEVYAGFHKIRHFPFPNRSCDNIRSLNILKKNFPAGEMKNVLEIGSNRGDFLYIIKEELRDVNVLGVEPTKFSSLRVPTINAFFKKELFSGTFDVIIMQHVLEHIKDLGRIIADVLALLNDDGILYVEIPYIVKNLQNGIDDFSLEHVNYFTFQALAAVLKGCRLVDYETDFFLRTIWRKGTDNGKESYGEPYDLTQGIQELEIQKGKIIDQIVDLAQAGKKMVFYGMSYYFRAIFRELEDKIEKANCFYYDDNFHGKYEVFFHLPRLSEFGKDCVVLICSNNFEVQKRIEEKIPNRKGMIVIRPWNRLSQF